MKSLLLALFTVVGVNAYAMIPLEAIDPVEDAENFYFYESIALGTSGEPSAYLGNVFETPLYVYAAIYENGTAENPYNLVLNVNGNVYYVDTLLSSVVGDENGVKVKIRRRWENPGEGIFLRLEGTRTNPETGEVVYRQLWVKIGERNGASIQTLEVFQGDFDDMR